MTHLGGTKSHIYAPQPTAHYPKDKQQSLINVLAIDDGDPASKRFGVQSHLWPMVGQVDSSKTKPALAVLHQNWNKLHSPPPILRIWSPFEHIPYRFLV